MCRYRRTYTHMEDILVVCERIASLENFLGLRLADRQITTFPAIIIWYVNLYYERN